MTDPLGRGVFVYHQESADVSIQPKVSVTFDDFAEVIVGDVTGGATLAGGLTAGATAESLVFTLDQTETGGRIDSGNGQRYIAGSNLAMPLKFHVLDKDGDTVTTYLREETGETTALAVEFRGPGFFFTSAFPQGAQGGIVARVDAGGVAAVEFQPFDDAEHVLIVRAVALPADPADNRFVIRKPFLGDRSSADFVLRESEKRIVPAEKVDELYVLLPGQFPRSGLGALMISQRLPALAHFIEMRVPYGFAGEVTTKLQVLDADGKPYAGTGRELGTVARQNISLTKVKSFAVPSASGEPVGPDSFDLYRSAPLWFTSHLREAGDPPPSGEDDLIFVPWYGSVLLFGSEETDESHRIVRLSPPPIAPPGGPSRLVDADPEISDFRCTVLSDKHLRVWVPTNQGGILQVHLSDYKGARLKLYKVSYDNSLRVPEFVSRVPSTGGVGGVRRITPAYDVNDAVNPSNITVELNAGKSGGWYKFFFTYNDPVGSATNSAEFRASASFEQAGEVPEADKPWSIVTWWRMADGLDGNALAGDLDAGDYRNMFEEVLPDFDDTVRVNDANWPASTVAGSATEWETRSVYRYLDQYKETPDALADLPQAFQLAIGTLVDKPSGFSEGDLITVKDYRAFISDALAKADNSPMGKPRPPESILAERGIEFSHFGHTVASGHFREWQYEYDTNYAWKGARPAGRPVFVSTSNAGAPDPRVRADSHTKPLPSGSATIENRPDGKFDSVYDASWWGLCQHWARAAVLFKNPVNFNDKIAAAFSRCLKQAGSKPLGRDGVEKDRPARPVLPKSEAVKALLVQLGAREYVENFSLMGYEYPKIVMKGREIVRNEDGTPKMRSDERFMRSDVREKTPEQETIQGAFRAHRVSGFHEFLVRWLQNGGSDDAPTGPVTPRAVWSNLKEGATAADDSAQEWNYPIFQFRSWLVQDSLDLRVARISTEISYMRYNLETSQDDPATVEDESYKPEANLPASRVYEYTIRFGDDCRFDKKLVIVGGVLQEGLTPTGWNMVAGTVAGADPDFKPAYIPMLARPRRDDNGKPMLFRDEPRKQSLEGGASNPYVTEERVRDRVMGGFDLLKPNW